MTQPIPTPIKERFVHWSDIACWVLCNPEKQPISTDGNLLQWKTSPRDQINTLPIIEKRMGIIPGAGFGIILGEKNSLCCFDFDHALDENGTIINPIVDEFLKIVRSFVEVSISGRGLHLFVNLDLAGGKTPPEYSYKPEFCDGKVYTGRFIRLTGLPFQDYDLPVQTITSRDFETIRKKIGFGVFVPQSPKKSTATSFNSDVTDWDRELNDAGIIHIKAQYEGKTRTYPDGKSRAAIEAYRIPCPNRASHTDIERRKDKFGPDAAILISWDDGTSSLTCNHNACSPENKPNLLQMLWNEIRQIRANEARAFLKKYQDGDRI